MTRDWDTPPSLRGQTFLVAEHGAIEHAPNGLLWHAKARLPDDDDPLRAVKGIGLGLLIMLAVFAGIIAALRWAL